MENHTAAGFYFRRPFYDSGSSAGAGTHPARREFGLADMNEKKYYVVTRKAIPEVLLKVVEVKRLLAASQKMTVSEASAKVGISRSSFYKYKDDIFEFHESTQGRTLTFVLEIIDQPGLLSDVLSTVARCRANVLTIHQSIPTQGYAQATISVEVLPQTEDVALMMDRIEQQEGVKNLRILGAE